LKFKTMVELGGKTATGMQVPEEVVMSLGTTKRPPVKVTINGYTYRSTVAVMGGRYMLPVSEEVRRNAGVAAGDEVEVDIELDTEPRQVTVPPDFAQALESEQQAKEFFEKLSYSNKRRIILQIEQAKAAETRQRRLDKAVSMRKEGKI
jgi:hypothetical protein